MKITAAVLTAANRPFEFRELELAAVHADEMIVRITSAGVCHTDIGVQPFVPLPAVLGHEGTGIVEELGNGVTEFAVGDRVSLTFGSCGHCRNCSKDMPAHCYDTMKINFSGLSRAGKTTLQDANGDGVHGSFFYQSSFASHALVNQRNAVRLASGVQHRYAGPLGCGIQTGAGAVINTFGASTGDTIACFGVGAVGLSAVMAASMVDCTTIIAVDINPSRLSLASTLGATHAIQTHDKIVEEILDITNGGADFAFDSAGTTQTFHAAIESLRMGGHAGVAAVPNWMEGFHFKPGGLAMGRTVSGILEGSSVPKSFIPQLYRWYEEGKLPIDRLMRFYPFSEINTAMRDLKQGTVIKPVLLMDAD